MMDLLVVNYNTQTKLKRLLDTLTSDFEEGVWRLYIADNGSTDRSAEWLRSESAYYPIEQVFYNENIGYAGAINQIAAATDNEVLAAINADTWFTTNHVKQAYQTFVDNPRQGVMGPKQMDESNKVRHGGIFGQGINLEHRGWGKLDPYDELYKTRDLAPTVSGSLYYIRRVVWDDIVDHPAHKETFGNAGAFGTFPHYWEETLFSFVTRHLGYEVWYDGEVETAGHSWAASLSIKDPWLRETFLEGKNLFMQACKNYGIIIE